MGLSSRDAHHCQPSTKGRNSEQLTAYRGTGPRAEGPAGGMAPCSTPTEHARCSAVVRGTPARARLLLAVAGCAFLGWTLVGASAPSPTSGGRRAVPAPNRHDQLVRAARADHPACADELDSRPANTDHAGHPDHAGKSWPRPATGHPGPGPCGAQRPATRSVGTAAANGWDGAHRRSGNVDPTAAVSCARRRRASPSRRRAPLRASTAQGPAFAMEAARLLG
jgi:hypothetical protein